jgi:hypothetical protein
MDPQEQIPSPPHRLFLGLQIESKVLYLNPCKVSLRAKCEVPFLAAHLAW